MYSAGWYKWLAENVLKALEMTLQEGPEKMGPAMRKAYNNAVKVAEHGFKSLIKQAKELPMEMAATVLMTVFAFGVLVALAPSTAGKYLGHRMFRKI